MQIDLSSLTYLSEIDLFKTIVSSADVFPGLYRMSSPWKKSLETNRLLKLLSFFEISLASEKGRRWNRNKWLEAHDELFNLSYGKDSRNDQRAEDDIKLILKKKGYNWYKKPKSFSLALIDNQTPVTQIQMNQTYYMMGSLLRFEEQHCLVSHDDLLKQSVLRLNVGYLEANSYIQSTFSESSLQNLFFQAQIVAHLNFDHDDVGTLDFDAANTESLFQRFPANCPIFASVNYKRNLPIRFAKLIGVSNVLA